MWPASVRNFSHQSSSRNIPSTWFLNVSRSFVINKISLSIGHAWSFYSLVGSAFSKDFNANFLVSLLESKEIFIRLRFPVKAYSTLPLLVYLFIGIGLWNFFVSVTSQNLFVAASPFNWLMFNSLKYSIGAHLKPILHLQESFDHFMLTFLDEFSRKRSKSADFSVAKEWVFISAFLSDSMRHSVLDFMISYEFVFFTKWNFFCFMFVIARASAIIVWHRLRGAN